MLHKQTQWTQENQIRELCKAWHPKRGEVVLVDFGNGLGSEYKNLRPSVIVSNNKNNEHSTVISVCPITSQSRSRLPVHVRLDQRDKLRSESICCVEQTRSIDKKRCLINGSIIVISQLSDSKMAEIDNALKIQFNLF